MTTRTPKTRRRVIRRRRLQAELLEDRRLLTVLTVNDLSDGTLASLAGDGKLSLREAIEAANTDATVDGSPAGSGPDEINFADELFGQINLTAGNLVISDDLTITGPRTQADAGIEINGDDSTQILDIAADTDVTLQLLALWSGYADFGGAIRNAGSLTLIETDIVANRATIDGAGIYNTGSLTVIDSSIRGNQSNRDGGGIFNSGTTQLINSTLRANRARGSGAGIHNASGTLTLVNSSLTSNRGDTDGDDVGAGGGIWTADDPSASTSLFNTLLVNNDSGGFSNGTILPDDLAGKDVDPSSAYNFVSDPLTAGGLLEGVQGNLVGDGNGNPLGSEQINEVGSFGGFTYSVGLSAGSRAIDAGNSNLATTLGNDGIPGTGDAGEVALLNDQRGKPFERTAGSSVDIGAYERQTLAAEHFVVTTNVDEIDYDNDELSLREAINNAMGSVGAATITFVGPKFEGLFPANISLRWGQLNVYPDAPLTISGTGRDRLIVDGRNQFRVFYIEGGDNDVTLENLTVRRGRTQYDGAGILFLDGTLTITDSLITGNTASDFGWGGGIYSNAPVHLSRTQITGNQAGDRGGGVFLRDVSYESTITDSTITGNTAGSEGGGAYAAYVRISNSEISGNTASFGGGLSTFNGTIIRSSISGNTATDGGAGGIYSSAYLELRQSTIVGNSAAGNGGGITANDVLEILDSTIANNSAGNNGGGILDSANSSIVNSTISGNTANRSGGGIYNYDGNLAITHSTIVGNRANADGDADGSGGGIWTYSDNFAFTHLFNTIVGGNRTGLPVSDFPSDLAGKDVEPGSAHNLISDPLSPGGLAEAVSGNRVGDGSGAYLELDSILSNTPALQGGPTLTFRLVPGSRAIDAGDEAYTTTPGDDGIPGTGDANETPLNSDQRGQPFERNFAAAVDIGAYEQQSLPESSFVVTTTADELDFGNAQRSLREAIQLALGSEGDDTITFGGSVFADAQPDTIQLQLGQLTIQEFNVLTIQGPGSDMLRIDGMSQSRVISFAAAGGVLHLDGLTISGGRSVSGGAGIEFLDGDSLLITDSTIRGNTATSWTSLGGGIYSSAPVTVRRSQITDNQAVAAGGGIYANGASANSTIESSVISGNSINGNTIQGGNGGGIYARSLQLTDSTVSENYSNGDGGGIAGSNLTINGSQIVGNTADGRGGGAFTSGSLRMVNSTLSGNSANQQGGGLQAIDLVTIEDSSLSDNTAYGSGGGVVISRGDLTLVNSTLSGNRSRANSGGAVYGSRSNVRMIQSTVTNNQADRFGGGIMGPIHGSSDTLIVHSSIIAGNLAGNSAPDISIDVVDTTLSVQSSLVGVNAGSGLLESQTPDPTTGNLIGTPANPIDPLLGNLAIHGGTTATHELLPGSPALDAGNATLAIGPGADGLFGTGDDQPLAFDQRGGPFVRAAGSQVDMGAYERQTLDPSLLVVTTTADNLDAADGEITLREAISHAGGSIGDDTITFDPALFVTPQRIQLQLGPLSIVDSDRVQILGPGPELLAIDAQQRSRVINLSGYGDLELSGLTITGGRTTGDFLDGDGPGVHAAYGSTLTVTDSTITGNTATGQGVNGGGIYSYADLTINNSTISGNRATGVGGGIYSLNSVTITDSTISDNSASSTGGGIWANQVALLRSNLVGNTADSNGGGLIVNLGTVTIQQSTISGNSAGGEGGGVHAPFGVEVFGSTIFGNTADLYGGGIAAPFSGDVTIINSTISGNQTSDRGGGLFFDDGDVRILNSTIVNNTANGAGGGIGNLNDGFGETLTIENSIIAGNTDVGSHPDFVPPSDPATNLSVKSSLIGDNTGTSLSPSPTPNPINGNLIGDPTSIGRINPSLAPLASHGGLTPTHALRADSPAIDVGNADLLPADDFDLDGDDDRLEPLPRDQRELSRIQDAGLDIGAVEFHELDFGDAPPSFGTSLADDGARHVASGPRLGDLRDSEDDGAASAAADGDDNNADNDEDGAMFGLIRTDSTMTGLNVDLQGSDQARVDAWVDFNGNGTWEASEQILTSVSVVEGLQTLNFTVPADAVAGISFARVRISQDGGLGPSGFAPDGEVEDYRIEILAPPTVESVLINGGAPARSNITDLRVTFDHVVDIDTAGGDPFQLINLDTMEMVQQIAAVDNSSGQTVVDLTFVPGVSVHPGGGLLDGKYQLTIVSDLVTASSIPLDGDGDGQAGGDLAFLDDFYRKYGDFDSDGLVTILDFAIFRAAYASSTGDADYDPDWDNTIDGVIDLTDFAKFRDNYDF